LNYGLETV